VGRRGRTPRPHGEAASAQGTEKLVPFFTSGELSKLERACEGRSFAQRRDYAIISVFRATGIRVSELAGIRHDPGDPGRSDLDLWQREIRIHGKGGKGGKGGKVRIVRIGREAARRLDRYIRVRARHGQAFRPELWLGVNNRGPMTAGGIYQMIVRRGRQCGVEVYPHRFRHHFSYTWLDRGGAEGDLMELNGWTSPQMLRRYGASVGTPVLLPRHGRQHMTRATTVGRVISRACHAGEVIQCDWLQAAGPGP
jgi:integrase/recombinase XerD